jgi:hypothetical protein
MPKTDPISEHKSWPSGWIGNYGRSSAWYVYTLRPRTHPLTIETIGTGNADCMRGFVYYATNTQLTASTGPSTHLRLWCLGLQSVDNWQARYRRGTSERRRGRVVSNAAQR